MACEGALQAGGPATGMVEDFEVVTRIVKTTVVNELDHRSLNDVIENPTAERIVLWIWRRLEGALPGLAELTLWETRRAAVVLKRGDPLIPTG